MAASNDSLFKLMIKWECINGEYPLFRTEEYEIGAFYHHSHQHSIRTQTWNTIYRKKKEKYKKSVAIQVVPYIRGVKTGKRYNIILEKKGKNFKRYRLACSSKDEKILDKYLSLYPMILLTPDDKSGQQRLKEFLTGLNGYDLIDPLIFGLKYTTYKEYPAVKYKGKRIDGLGDLLDPVLSKRQLSFLNTWTGGAITVAVPGSQGKKYWYRVIPQDREQYDEHRGVTFSIHLPEDINETYIIDYGGEQVESRGGETFEITLEESDLPQEIKFQFKEVYLRDCSFNHWLAPDQAIDWKGVTLKPVCKRNIIFLPDGSGKIKSIKGCVNKKPEVKRNKLECIRLKTKNLTIKGNGWEKTIRKNVLNLNKNSEYKLEPTVTTTFQWQKELNKPKIEGCENKYKIKKQLDRYFTMDCERKLNSSVTFKWNNGLKHVVTPGNTNERVVITNSGEVVELDSCGEDLPIEVYTEDVPYSPNSKFILFKNEQDCEDINDQKQNIFLYQFSTLESVTSNECEWARVVKGREGVSLCAKGERREGKIYFDMLPD